MQIKQIVKTVGKTLSNNSPAILTGMAVSGALGTAIFSIKATPKAIRILEQETKRREFSNANEWLVRDPKDFTKFEVIKLTWKGYVPAAACCAVTIGSVVALNTVHLRRTAALATIYSITETAFKEYQDKVAETIGKNKELAIRDEISKDRVKRNPTGANEVIITGSGDVLCLDTLSGRYFRTDIEKIRRIVNELNRDLLTEMYVSLNDFYFELGLPMNGLGNDMGWNIDDGLIDISYSSQLTDEGTPCLVLTYEVFPKCYK